MMNDELKTSRSIIYHSSLTVPLRLYFNTQRHHRMPKTIKRVILRYTQNGMRTDF